MDQELEKRKEKLSKLFKFKGNTKSWIGYVLLAIIIWFGYFIRTKNLGLLIDRTTNKFIPLALDPHVVLRYSKFVAENGYLMAHDALRYFPLGYTPTYEMGMLSYFIAYLYKFLHFFNSSLVIEKVHVLYPPIVFGVALIFFFLLVRRLFDYRVALISSAFLAVIPTFLYRTMAGFADKEALGTLFMFIALYFFVVGWQSKGFKNNVLFGLLSGIFAGIMGYTWGGVQFVYLLVGFFILIELMLNKFKKNDFYMYSAFFIALVIMATNFLGKYSVLSFVSSITTGLLAFVFFMGIIDFVFFKHNFLNMKKRFEGKVPLSVINLIFSVIIFVILSVILIDPGFIAREISDTLTRLIQPFPTRWASTVAESHQPYITDWINSLGVWVVWLFIVSSILLFYEMTKRISKKSWIYTIVYSLFILSFIFSKYSPQAQILNGTSGVAKFMYLGSITFFILILFVSYLYFFYKRKDLFNKILKIDKKYIFVFIWFLVNIIMAKTAIRLLFVFSQIVVILWAYFFIQIADYLKKIKKDQYKLIGYVLILIFVMVIFVNYAKADLNQTKNTGPSYNGQWQNAMAWVRENTPEDAVFAHWWDYGYWVQTGGNRATITDGGNNVGAWNYFMGRHVLTGQNETEALEFLKAHNATNLLIISDEIGKYPAFSLIGSDENYDRYSWIPAFNKDPTPKETRDETIFIYRGGFLLDDDFTYNDVFFPREGAGIGGFFLPTQQEEGNLKFKQPNAALVYAGQQYNVPVECLFIGGREITFPEPGLKGCLMLLPRFQGQNVDPMGAAIYISEKVRKTLFTQLYLFGKKSDYFKLVYQDNDAMPLSVYNGRIIGPLKIWEISYPDNLDVPDYFYGTKLPNPKVTILDR